MILLRAWVGGWENRVLHLNSQSDLGIAASFLRTKSSGRVENR